MNSDSSSYEPYLPPECNAPEWLKERMRAIHALPPPTLEQVIQQFKASAEHRSKMEDKSDIVK